jgi:DNA-binding GntR family transcriptional regulator
VVSGQRRSQGALDDAGTQVTTAPHIADQVHAILRAQIISGELTPNQRLTERGLSSTLGVSPTPVREAISQLEYERLLVRVDGRLLVAAPDARRLRELSLVQAALRGVAARLAAENASDAELAEIAAAYEGPSAAAAEQPKSDEGRLQKFRRRRQFHELIDQAAHNPTLSDMIATTTAFDFQLKSRALLHGAFPDPHPAIAEHREILDALLARDGTRAEVLMREHTTTGADRYLAYATSEAKHAQPPKYPAAVATSSG